MTKLVLANSNYKYHMTDEGDQLQLGLQHAGWILSGKDYDGIQNVDEALKKYDPDIVFVQDQRDWDKQSPGSFGDSKIMWEHITALRDHRCYVVGVCKDAGSVQKRQEHYLMRQGCNAVVHYYHPDTILKLSPYLDSYKLIRTYHSIDTLKLPPVGSNAKGVIISGAKNPDVYPLRQKLYDRGVRYQWTLWEHPGYGKKGCCQKEYYDALQKHKVSIATASSYNFALRKIIESVAMGCIAVTDLFETDVLPEIDEYLVRVGGISPKKICYKINDLAMGPTLKAEAVYMARSFYDYRSLGIRLDKLILEAYNEGYKKHMVYTD